MEVPVIKNAKKQDYLVCYLCENDWIETQAKGFCLECRKYMCTACFDKHTKRKIGRNHTLAPTREAVSTAGSSEDEEFEKCTQHIGEYIKCYCLKHEQVGCGDCMALEHKRCNVKSIRDVAILFKDSQKFKDLVKGVEECHIRAKKIATSVKKSVRGKAKHQPSILWRIPEGVPIKTYGTLQPISARHQICKNIEVNGYYLSHASNGTGFGFCIFDNGGQNEFCFEVEIVSMGHHGVIAIGIAPRIYPANLLPGWGSHSVAYHAHDGRLYQENHFGRRNGPQCNVGDRIEVNCRCNSGTYYVHFKRNGETIGEASCGRNVFKRLYPAIGLRSFREKVTIKLDRMLY